MHSQSSVLIAFIACVMVAVTSAFTGSLAVSRSAASATARSMSGFDDFGQETPEDTKERIQALVENNPVLLFMKGSKLFPQCGFSNTACQILQSYDIDFHSVDVLSDEAIRTGVKDFSMWPTIPQLYVVRQFVSLLLVWLFLVLICWLVVGHFFPSASGRLIFYFVFSRFVTTSVRRIHWRIGHYDRDVPERRARRNDRKGESINIQICKGTTTKNRLLKRQEGRSQELLFSNYLFLFLGRFLTFSPNRLRQTWFK